MNSSQIKVGLKVDVDGVREVRNIAYAVNDGYPQRLDLFLPEKGETGKLPCIGVYSWWWLEST